MQNQSHLDKKYFVSSEVYNCPFCGRQHVAYDLERTYCFNWSKQEKCFAYFVECKSCRKISMHLSHKDITNPNQIENQFKSGIDIDSYMFYSAPASFIAIDERIPKTIRELISETEGCLKMNYLTAASACIRRAIYELLVYENVKGSTYKDNIKFLRQKYPNVNKEYFSILLIIGDVTDDGVHQQSWYKWDIGTIRLFNETIKAVLYEIYVIPQIMRERSIEIQKLQENLKREQEKKLIKSGVSQ
ncbi:hypothetical protein ACFLW2_02695 [Chloroflexota bacterium]